MRRVLGRSGIEVSALGLGCWAIGGPYHGTGSDQYGWGEVDDDETVRAIRRGLDLGVTLFDTASSYGSGHSEEVLGRALGGRRGEVVIATKFGWTFDAATRTALGADSSAQHVRGSAHASARRLGTDYLDLYQLHLGDLPIPEALDLIPTLEDLVTEGTIRWYGWSTDDAERAAAFAAAGAHCTAIQYDHSVLHDAPAMVEALAKHDQAGINRGPLAMGLLGGRYHDGRKVAADDVRSMPYEWMSYFRDGTAAPEWLARIDAVREALTVDGRTLAQGALGWLWARSGSTIPIPGFRTVTQAEQNAQALSHGPLSPEAFAEVERLLADLRGTGG
jgi:aryl-alcohol dehydrogenase-like predicted oxidoreductase